MHIRFAKAEDKTAVLNLLDELLQEDCKLRGIKPDHTPVKVAGNKIFDELLDKDDYKIFVAEENEKILGVSTLFLFPALRRGVYRAQVEEMVVSKDMRGKGVGTVLLQAVIKWCKEQDIHYLRINSALYLSKAHEFYEKNGGVFQEKMFRFDIK